MVGGPQPISRTGRSRTKRALAPASTSLRILSFGQVLHLRSCPRYGNEVWLCPDKAGWQEGRRDGNGEDHPRQRCSRILLLRLAQVLPNIPEFPIAFLGAAGAGITVTTANPTYRLHLYMLCSMLHLIFFCTSSPVYTHS